MVGPRFFLTLTDPSLPATVGVLVLSGSMHQDLLSRDPILLRVVAPTESVNVASLGGIF